MSSAKPEISTGHQQLFFVGAWQVPKFDRHFIPLPWKATVKAGYSCSRPWFKSKGFPPRAAVTGFFVFRRQPSGRVSWWSAWTEPKKHRTPIHPGAKGDQRWLTDW